jgi:hypothetical protein
VTVTVTGTRVSRSGVSALSTTAAAYRAETVVFVGSGHSVTVIVVL